MDDLVKELKKLNSKLDNAQPVQSPQGIPMIQRVHTAQQITMHEAVLFLWSLKESFPDSQTISMVDALLNHIVFKTTGIEIPTESGDADIVKED